MAGDWRARESVDLGEAGAVGGALLPALGRLGDQHLGFVLRPVEYVRVIMC